MGTTKRTGSEGMTRREFLRGVLAVGLGAAGASILSACVPATPSVVKEAGKEAAAVAPVATVNVFESCWDGEHIAAGKKLYEDFRKANPHLDVKDRWPVGEDWTEELLAAVAAGEQIDLVLWCGSPFTFMDEGKLLDLKPLMDADPTFDKADFYETMTGLLVDEQGHQFGWPYNYATTVIYYNTKMFQEAGVEFPTLDWTWDDLLAAAQQLTKDTGDPTTQKWGYLFRAVDLEHMCQSWGGNWVNANEKRCDFTKQETIDALQFFSDLIYKYKVSPQAPQMAGQSPVTMFASQRVAIVGLPEWGLLEFNRAHEKEGLEYDVTLMPKGKAGRKTRLRPAQVTILKATRNPQAAWEVLKFVVSPTYEMKMQVEIPESPPPRKSVNEKKFRELLTYPKSRELFLESPNYGIYPFYDLRYGKEMEDVIWPQIDLLMLGKERDAGVLAGQICDEVNKKFAELG